MTEKTVFGILSDGRTVDCYTLSNAAGMTVRLLTLGAVIQSIQVPDRDGLLREVALHYEDAAAYEVNDGFLGACIAPNGNRIAGASYELNGVTWQLEANDGENNLHSGSGNAGLKLWEAEAAEDTVTMRIKLPDGEAGFPGNRDVAVTYRLTPDNALEIIYEAQTDKDTILNMTNHSYFNLGDREDHVLETWLWIDAGATTEVGAGLIPNGRLAPVEGTPFDFREAKRIGRDAFADNAQLALGGGYDHNFVLNGTGYRKVAEAWLPATGLGMEVWTDQPGMQLYTGNFLHAPYGKNRGFALETQHHPDSIHYPEFPSVVTRAGERYTTKTAYRFFVR